MKKHVRIAALQCNFQTPEQTLSMPDFWAENGFNTEQLLHTHADLYSAIYDPKRHKALMEQYLLRSKANGIRTIVYMNCHILGPSLKEHFGDWCIRQKDNSQKLLYSTYPACCLNSGWRGYFFSCIESLAEFDLEGLFFDGPAYNDCRCPDCQKKYLAETGKTMAESTDEEIHAFTLRSVLAFKQELRKKVKAVNPAWNMYFNEGLFSGLHTSAEMSAHLATDDLVGIEGGFFFYCEPRKLPYWRCSVFAKMAEAAAQGKPTVIFFAADHKSWGWYLHTPTELRLCYADAIANGASVWLGIHSNPDNYNTKSGRAVLDMVKYDARNDACYQNTRSLAEVAVFYSYDTASHVNNIIEESDFYGKGNHDATRPGNYNDAVNGAFAILEHQNIPYDVVNDLHPEDAEKYRVLLVPNASCVNDRTLEALHRFVQKGGLLLADGQFGFFDENGAPRKVLPEWIGALSDRKIVNQKTFNYISLQWEGFEADNAFGYQPSPYWMCALTPQEGAQVIARIPVPMEGCYAARPGKPEIPVGIRAKVGDGQICYVAGGLYEFYYGFQITAIRHWFQAIFARVPFQFRLEGALPGISMTVRQMEDGRVLVHLTNHVGATRPLDGVPAISGVTLKTPAEWTSGQVLMGAQELVCQTPGCFRLPPLGDVTVLALSR